MDTVTFAWTLTATVSAGVQLFFSKIIAHERRDGAFNGMMMYGVSGAIALGLLIAHPWPVEWLIIGAFGVSAGALHALGNYVRIESLKFIDSVIYFPINKMLGPLAVVIAGVALFGDALDLRQYVGIALSLTVPLLLLSAVEHHRQRNLRAGLIFALVSTFLTAVSVLLSKEGLMRGPDIFFMLGMSQVAGTTCSALIMFRQKGVRTMVSHIDRRDVMLGFVTGLIAFVSSFTLFKAFTTGYVSLVYVIQAHYILIPIILSVWWYREHINVRKAAAIVVSSLALILLYR